MSEPATKAARRGGKILEFLTGASLGGLGTAFGDRPRRTSQIKIMHHVGNRVRRIERYLIAADAALGKLFAANRYHLVVSAMNNMHNSVSTRYRDHLPGFVRTRVVP
jgi:hypothetical protein